MKSFSIVTPSFNQGGYIRDTINSVIGQRYQSLEYAVLDGGSSDGTLQVLEEFDHLLTYWRSHRDEGQAAAINEGVTTLKGDIIGWINSDDYYLPSALEHVAARLDPSRPEILFGNCLHFVEGGGAGHGSDVKNSARIYDLRLRDYIIQPATFFTRSAWELVGPLDQTLCYTFDWDWFIRAQIAGVNFIPDDRYLAAYRLHPAHKSGQNNSARASEIERLYDVYSGSHYARAARHWYNNRGSINSIHRTVHKLRLERFEGHILKAIFPTGFSGLTAKETTEILFT